LEALLFSTAVVALAEMGDKTQLLSFVLAAKLKRKVPIALGILFATLANHFLAGYVGAWLARVVFPETLKWVIAVSFFVFALWALKPDTLDENRKLRGTGVFVTTLIAFLWLKWGQDAARDGRARGTLRLARSGRSRNDARDDDCEHSGRMVGRGACRSRQHESDEGDCCRVVPSSRSPGAVCLKKHPIHARGQHAYEREVTHHRPQPGCLCGWSSGRRPRAN